MVAAASSYKETGQVNLASVALGAVTGGIGGAFGASGLHTIGQAAISGLLGAANNIGNSIISGKGIDWLDVGVDAAIGFCGSLAGSLVTKKAGDAAKGVIKKGINRVISGKTNYDAGSRYWKGAMKRGMRIIADGVKELNFIQGCASVIGSEVAGIASTVKLII